MYPPYDIELNAIDKNVLPLFKVSLLIVTQLVCFSLATATAAVADNTSFVGTIRYQPKKKQAYGICSIVSKFVLLSPWMHVYYS